MKKLILLLFIFGITNPIFSQSLEVGMELKYTVELDWLPPNSPPRIITLIVKKDTIINGETAFCIAKEDEECGEHPYHLFGQDSTHLYFYDNDAKHLFHDYSLTAGDTLRVKHLQSGLDSLYIRIDDTGVLNKSGRSFKVQYINPHIEDPRGTQDYHGMDYGTIIEGIGSTLEFFFSSPVASPTPCLHSVKYPGEAEIIFDTPCFSQVPVSEKTNEAEISIYPNPGSDFIEIKFEKVNPKSADLLLFDATGKLVKHFFIEKNQSTIRLDWQVAPGLYFYKIQSDNLVLKKGKLIRL